MHTRPRTGRHRGANSDAGVAAADGDATVTARGGAAAGATAREER